ncbi:MAG: hypothetical protein LUF27_17035 [Lachnospiraceae bacterium]|nr:hypothetical protein [Lachnospiraceae bacterium]
MEIYSLSKMNTEGTLLNPVNTMYSEEYAESMCRLYLTDEIVEDERGKRIRNYRLHAQAPHNIEMALAYDINCPRCGGRLKQVGRSRDSHTLGLYTCKACNRH